MRTTLALDDDLLSAARQLAERQGKTVGEVISSLARLGLQRSAVKATATRNGIPLLPTVDPSKAVTLELVNRLRDETP